MPVMAILGGKDVFIDTEETRRRLEATVDRLTLRFDPDGHHFMPGQTEPILRFLLDAP